MSDNDATPRVLAVVSGAALLLLAAVASPFILLVTLIATTPPDASEPDGDPCCAVPDTWAQAIQGALTAGAFLAIWSLVTGLAFALIATGGRGRPLTRRPVVLVPALVLTLFAVVLAVSWIGHGPGAPVQ